MIIYDTGFDDSDCQNSGTYLSRAFLTGCKREVSMLRGMAGETGRTGRDLPLRTPLISFPVWDPGGPIYNENGPFLLVLDCFSAIAIVVYRWFWVL